MEPLILHDIPIARQNGIMGHLEAMRLASIDTLKVFHEAAGLSGLDMVRNRAASREDDRSSPSDA